MTNEIRNNVLMLLSNEFTPQQLQMIDLAIAKSLVGYSIKKEETLPAPQDSSVPIEVREFLIRKRIKGCSEGTVKQYQYVLEDLSLWYGRSLTTMKDIDILAYLDYIKSKRSISNRTLDGKRLILSTFFTYMHDTGKISSNPMKTIDPIKHKQKEREPLTDMELEMVRGSCETLREKAIFETLYSTGCRVSEIVQLNYNDIDKNTRSAIVTGKRNQERYVFFSAKAILAIEKYMKSREDDNPALFVCSKSPHNRMKKGSIENEIRELGTRSGIGRDVFPHLLRHTFATDMLTHGAQINEVSQLLGHKKLETTKIYAKSNILNIKQSHLKYIA